MSSNIKKVLVIGGGAREHALCWVIARDHPEIEVLCTPGNGGIAESKRRNVGNLDLRGLVHLARIEDVDFVIVGPEDPLVNGIVNALEDRGIAAFGPNVHAAQLEGSKIYMKTLCAREGIPTAAWTWSDNYTDAKAAIRSFAVPPVIKADGLCAGKGVVVSRSHDEALEAARGMLVLKKFGEAGSRIVIEEPLQGRECSAMFLCDGENAVALPLARDYKRLQNGDKGPNTGGMGSYSPLPDVSDEVAAQIKEKIIMPTLRGMRLHEAGSPFQGLLYAGLMLTKDGPKLLEYNVRFGDPETQVVLPRIESDLLQYLQACTKLGGLAKLPPLKVSNKAAVCYVLASEGYPGKYKLGYPISNEEVAPKYGALLFHAGTDRFMQTLSTSGGRVMSVVGLGDTIEKARDTASLGANVIGFENKYRRTDIAEGV